MGFELLLLESPVALIELLVLGLCLVDRRREGAGWVTSPPSRSGLTSTLRLSLGSGRTVCGRGEIGLIGPGVSYELGELWKGEVAGEK